MHCLELFLFSILPPDRVFIPKMAAGKNIFSRKGILDQLSGYIKFKSSENEGITEEWMVVVQRKQGKSVTYFNIY